MTWLGGSGLHGDSAGRGPTCLAFAERGRFVGARAEGAALSRRGVARSRTPRRFRASNLLYRLAHVL